MTKEQTAIDWLIDELKSYGQYQVVGLYQSLFQLAKEREQQQLSAERERAGKLVEALKMCVDVLKGLDATDYVAYTAGKVALIEYQKTLNEYDTATKES